MPSEPDDGWITVEPGTPLEAVLSAPGESDWQTVPAPAKKTEGPGYGQQAGNVARIAADALTFGQWNRARAGSRH